MHYTEPIIRPPSEAESILLQVTTGCSHNKCTFCGVYKNKKFTITPHEIIAEDIEYASQNFQNARRAFLIDGDALVIPQRRLVPILKLVQEKLPWVSRVGTYANAKSIARKSDEELRELRSLGLKMIHMGLESGDNQTLEAVGKMGDASFIVKQGLRAREADIKLFVTVILGLAGKQRSGIHATATGEALTALNPEYVGSLSLMLLEEAPIYQEWTERGEELLSPVESLIELRTMLEHTELTPGFFYSNHASNYLPLRIRLPRDKENALKKIDEAIQGSVSIRPDWIRAL